MAFPSKFSSTWLQTRPVPGTGDSAGRRPRRRMVCWSLRPRATAPTSCAREIRSNGSRCSGRCPSSSRTMSARSSIRRAMRSDWVTIAPPRRSGTHLGAACSWARPRIAVRGERRSWATMARKSRCMASCRLRSVISRAIVAPPMTGRCGHRDRPDADRDGHPRPVFAHTFRLVCAIRSPRASCAMSSANSSRRSMGRWTRIGWPTISAAGSRKALRGRVPAGDRPVQGLADDGVLGVRDDRRQPLPVDLRLMAFRDIAQHRQIGQSREARSTRWCATRPARSCRLCAGAAPRPAIPGSTGPRDLPSVQLASSTTRSRQCRPISHPARSPANRGRQR